MHIDVEVIVDVDLAVFECLYLVKERRQGFEGWVIRHLKPFFTIAVFILEGTSIQVILQRPDSLIDLINTTTPISDVYRPVMPDYSIVPSEHPTMNASSITLAAGFSDVPFIAPPIRP